MRKKALYVAVLTILTGFPLSAYAETFRPSPVGIVNTTVDSASGIAKAPNGDIWVSDWSADRVYLYGKDATGAANALKTISLFPTGGTSGSTYDASSIAVDAAGFLYVADCSANKIYVFDPSLGDNQFVGSAVRTIVLGHRSREITLDSDGKIYAAGKFNGHLEVRIYAAGVTSSANNTALVTFTDSSTTSTDEPYGLGVLPNGKIAVAWWDQADIRVYSTSTSGDISPLYSIAGSNSQIGPNLGKLVTDLDGRIYIYDSGTNQIFIFAPGAEGDVAPLKAINMARIVGGASNSYIVHYGWAITLGNDGQIWAGDDDLKIVHFANPFTPTLPALVSSDSGAEASRAAEAARVLKVAIAKATIEKSIASGGLLTLDALQCAGLPGVTVKNVDLINRELAELPFDIRADITTVEKIAFKYATVDKISNAEAVTARDLITVGLISPDSKLKASILVELKKLPVTSIDTYAEIQAAVAAVEKRSADRKARIAALLARFKG
jgi:hypothetical protein